MRLEKIVGPDSRSVMEKIRRSFGDEALVISNSRSENKNEWIVFASLLKDVGDKAFEAAEAKDVEALFQIGAELYQVCVACHQVYMNE